MIMFQKKEVASKFWFLIPGAQHYSVLSPTLIGWRSRVIILYTATNSGPITLILIYRCPLEHDPAKILEIQTLISAHAISRQVAYIWMIKITVWLTWFIYRYCIEIPADNACSRIITWHIEWSFRACLRWVSLKNCHQILSPVKVFLLHDQKYSGETIWKIIELDCHAW